MKKIIILIMLLNINCYSGSKKNTPLKKGENNIINDKEYSNCNLGIFNNFRKNIKDTNIQKISAFFDFPLDGSIWDIIYLDSVDAIYDTDIPFTRDSFFKYYRNIFSSDFVRCLFKINEEKLFNQGEYYTEIFSKTDNQGILSKYRIKSYYNKDDEKLTLMLYYEYYEDDEKYETAIGYVFTLYNCKINFQELVLAG